MSTKKANRGPNKISSYLVKGGSMWPLFKSGDVLIVRPVTHLLPGALVAFRNSEGTVICHRFHYKKDGMYYFKGDACVAFDPPVAPTAVLGEVLLATRGGACIDLEKKRYLLLKYGQIIFIGPLAHFKSGRNLLSRFLGLSGKFGRYFKF